MKSGETGFRHSRAPHTAHPVVQKANVESTSIQPKTGLSRRAQRRFEESEERRKRRRERKRERKK